MLRCRVVWRALGFAFLLATPSMALAQGDAPDGAAPRPDAQPWTVTAAHTLLWDGKPYIPVGGVFEPRLLRAGALDADAAADAAALDTLKSKGLLDVIIRPPGSPLAASAGQWQRLIDMLEARGFRYGVGFGTGMDAPLTGHVIWPSAYRTQPLEAGADATWEVTDGDSAWFILVDPHDGTRIYREGNARVERGVVTSTGRGRVEAGAVGLLYPRKAIRPQHRIGLPDFWQHYDGYRDALIGLFGGVRFGAGLRFFLDPLGPAIGWQGEAEHLVPDSPGFRLEWEAYLGRRYPHVDDLLVAWAIADTSVKDIRTAAGLIPLWSGGKGIPFFLDLATGSRIQITGGTGRFWRDFEAFRAESVVHHLDAMADALKREVANVPVVYTYTDAWPAPSAFATGAGFDGVGIMAYGRGSALVTGGADAAHSFVREAGRRLWCLVVGTAPSIPSLGAPAAFESRADLAGDLDWLRGIGAKGFFVEGFQLLSGAEVSPSSLLSSPEQLVWLSEHAARLGAETELVGLRPRVLPYPAAAAGVVRSGLIGESGVWWAPSRATGQALDFGSSYAGYTIALPDGERTVLWSVTGPRETRLWALDPSRVSAETVDGRPAPIRADRRRRTATLMLDTTPVVLRTAGQPVFPLEAVEDAIGALRSLVAQGTAAQALVQDHRFQLDRAEAAFRQGDMIGAYASARQGLAGIVEVLQPFTWREAEGADPHTFTDAMRMAAASGSGVLMLNTSNRPPREGYTAQIRFSVPADDQYTVWLAASPAGNRRSPFVWLVNTGEPQACADAEKVGHAYMGDQLAWLKLGSLNLTKGQHTFTIRVTDRAPGTDRYQLLLDALLVTRGPFAPNGTLRPSAAVPAASPAPRAAAPDRRAR
ncbi:MAG TPA: hypothetical protein VLH79_05400 [Chthonomonadales bacterium]|nr:hypothetical protein [Chthonomonadales bacterium]